MIDFRVRSGLTAGLILFLFFAGCAKRIPIETEIAPEVEAAEEEPVAVDEEEAAQAAITRAETDISDAVNSGAKRYANELLSDAEGMLISAKDAFEEEDFLKAKKDAEESSSLANEAKSLAVKKIKEEKLLSKEEKERIRLEEERRRAKIARERSRKERLERERLERKRLEKGRLEAEAKSSEMLVEEKERARRQLLRKRNRVVVVGVILVVLIGLVIRVVVQKGKKVQ